RARRVKDPCGLPRRRGTHAGGPSALPVSSCSRDVGVHLHRLGVRDGCWKEAHRKRTLGPVGPARANCGHSRCLITPAIRPRTRRMQGYNVLFQPGYDHAGISTQNAVEKHLAAQGKTRQDLGREAFVALVWDWLREYGGKIMFQFRRIGASLDYRRERFTMDDAYVRAVMRFFVHLWNKGWLYRANRIVNWCPFHLTSLSDLELAHLEV